MAKPKNIKKLLIVCLISLLITSLITSIGINVYHSVNFRTYLQNTDMVYFKYMPQYTVGESDNRYLLLPENFNKDFENMISPEAVEASPIK